MQADIQPLVILDVDFGFRRGRVLAFGLGPDYVIGGAGGHALRRSRVVTVFTLLFLVYLVVHLFFLHLLQFQGTGGDHLEVGATLGTGNDIALVHFIDLDIEVALTFRTLNHSSLRQLDGTAHPVCYYLEFLSPQRQ